MDISRIYHYTSVDSLALILASRKLRFNRLDRVDDLREAQTHLGIEFGKYFFVSCWTRAQKESIPQWHMYTDKMAGVRISLPLMPFQRKRLRPKPEWNVQTQGELLSPLSLEEQFGDNYFIVPMFLEEDHFAAPVTYVENIEQRYSEAVRVSKSLDGRASLQISRPFDLACLKSTDWEFQAEYRFFLFVLPSIPVPKEGPGSPAFCEELPNHILHAMLNGIAPGIEHLDLDLSDEALDQIVVTTGPLCTAGAKLCVESLVERYAPHGRVETSCFNGVIRGVAR